MGLFKIIAVRSLIGEKGLPSEKQVALIYTFTYTHTSSEILDILGCSRHCSDEEHFLIYKLIVFQLNIISNNHTSNNFIFLKVTEIYTMLFH